MAEILLVNPRRRKRRKSKASGSRKRRRAARKVSYKRRRKSNHVHAFRRRRHKHASGGMKRYRRKRNPSLRGLTGGLTGGVMAGVKTGFVGALGALGLDVLYGFAAPKLPEALRSGPAAYLTKALAAVLVGMVGNKVLRGKGGALVTGAMTVVIHDALKTTIAQNFPNVPLGEYVGSSPIVGYGAPSAMGIPYQTGGQPSMSTPGAIGMGAYLSGYTTSLVEGDEWNGWQG